MRETTRGRIGYTDEELAERVARSRAEQGLPPKIEDPLVLHRIAQRMRDAADRAER